MDIFLCRPQLVDQSTSINGIISICHRKHRCDIIIHQTYHRTPFEWRKKPTNKAFDGGRYSVERLLNVAKTVDVNSAFISSLSLGAFFCLPTLHNIYVYIYIYP